MSSPLGWRLPARCVAWEAPAASRPEFRSRAWVACFLLLALLPGLSAAPKKVRVLVWSERSEPVEVYPAGINGEVASIFAADRGVEVSVANMLDPEQGLSEAALAQTDVLVWFGHRSHADVLPEVVDRVVRRVTADGMGFLPLHSAHYSLPFVRLMELEAAEQGVRLTGRVGSWGAVRNKGEPERVQILLPAHPIAKGLTAFTIEGTEEYANPFVAPPAEEKVLAGAWEGGEQDGSDGLAWTVGKGKVFYFRPGHETRPIFRQPEVRAVLRNAVLWLAP
ncbi:MAG: trehalose utilization protein ThuA [Acidobacteria bacterium]|nr:trehalose utilization protein ThuA [Acidobacteriota bacterium]